MPDIMPTVSPILILIIFLVFGSILGAWIWVILRLALQQPVLPPSTPRVVPWGWKSVLCVTVVYLFLLIVVGSGLLVILMETLPRGQGGFAGLSPTAMMTASAITNVMAVVLIPSILAYTCRAKLRDFGLQFSGIGKQFARGIVAYPLLAPLVFGVMLVALQIWKEPDTHPLQKAIREDKTAGMAVVLIMAGAVCAPVAEELVFRGVLLGWLTRRILLGKPVGHRIHPLDESLTPVLVGIDSIVQPPNDLEVLEPDAEVLAPALSEAYSNPFAPPLAAIGSSAVGIETESAYTDRPYKFLLANVSVSFLFAAMHASVWPTPIPIFFLSLGLGFLYQRTGSILAPIALHMTFNSVSTLLMFFSPVPPQPPTKPIAPIPAPVKVNPPVAERSGLPTISNLVALLDGSPQFSNHHGIRPGYLVNFDSVR